MNGFNVGLGVGFVKRVCLFEVCATAQGVNQIPELEHNVQAGRERQQHQHQDTPLHARGVGSLFAHNTLFVHKCFVSLALVDQVVETLGELVELEFASFETELQREEVPLAHQQG